VKRYFTKAEIDALVPRLTETMRTIMDAHAALRALESTLQAEQERIAVAGGARIDPATWRRAREALRQRTAEIERGVGAIAALGGVPKDLAIGLVDFAGRRDGRDVNLCWRYGETSLEYWHDLDEGYAARKPL
jgi:hypothetical protein